jgi:hypothetical protein
MMKLFGYPLDKEAKLCLLREVTLSADPEVLREIANFLLNCADGIDAKGDAWEHEHFKPSFEALVESDSQFIVFNPRAL